MIIFNILFSTIYLFLFALQWSILAIQAKVDTQHQENIVIKDSVQHSEKEHKGSEHLEPKKICKLFNI